MNTNGDDGAVAIEFAYARTRVNSEAWEVGPIDAGAAAVYPRIGVDAIPYGQANKEQGGDVLDSVFLVRVLCIGAEGVDDIEPLRPLAKELYGNMQAHSGQPGTIYSGAQILSCTPNMALTYPDTDKRGLRRWYHGYEWLLKIQPADAS